MKHLSIKIYGRVQGVFFRYSAKSKADELNLKGFVKNDPAGFLYIEAEGEPANLEEFLKWCKQGPSFAKVTRITVEEGELKNFQNFQIIPQSGQ